MVDNPLSKKFNTGQKEELRFLFCINEAFDVLPLPQQTALLKRLRLFGLVIHYNWATALRDRENQGVERGELHLDNRVIVKNETSIQAKFQQNNYHRGAYNCPKEEAIITQKC